MNITCLCGPSGAGKTHYYRNNLSNQKMFDIADVYRDYPGIDYQDAFAELLNRIQLHITDVGTDFVVEALFREERYQRDWMTYIAAMNGGEIKFMDFEAEPAVCRSRIEADWKGCDQSDLSNLARYNARVRILENYKNGS